MNKSLLFLIFSILIATSSELYSQGLEQLQQLQELENLDIDNLTDDQIGQLIQRLEASGMSEEQLIQMAEARGMSNADISKLRARILAVQEDGMIEDPTMIGNRIRLNPVQQDEIDDLMNPIENLARTQKNDSMKLFQAGLEVFGLRFFRESELSYEPNFNIPTPTNYVLGPGDQVYVDVWGASEQSHELTITPEGAVLIPGLGPINISGLTIEKAKSKVISRLKRIYSTIGGSSEANLTLGQIRTINVHVTGEVFVPGTYQLSSLNTVINALYAAQGPTVSGTLREIEVYRDSKLLTVFDGYKFFFEGSGNNISLNDQDIIVVKPYKNRIRLEGQIKKSAYYELTDDEALQDLINYAGGFTENAYRGVLNIERKEDNYTTFKSVTSENFDAFKMKDGDKLVVASITGEFKNRVTLIGPVRNPGNYELTPDLKLSELIKLADGVRGEIFYKRGVIIREEGDLSLTSISFDLEEVISGENDITLKSNDLIKLHSIHDLRESYTLKIEGEVLAPNTYNYSEGMTVENLIFLAKGFKTSAAKSFVEVARRSRTDSAGNINSSAQIFNFEISPDLSLSDKDSNFKLEPFDLVIVRKNPFYQEQELIEIEGEVLQPGKYALETKDERLSSILKRSGGLSPYAYPKGATLIRRTDYYLENKSNDYGFPEFLSDGDKEGIDKAAQIRKEDLSYRFRKEGFSAGDSLELFRGQESIGIDLQRILDNPGSKFDLILREGDIISIPREYQTVRVRGEVLYPSNIRHDNSSGFKRYISYAGGFDQNAKKNKSYIIYANGSAAQTKSFLWFRNYPRVEPGAEIVVPQKPEKEPVPPAAWATIGTAIATLALAINQILAQP